jgi:hypothetical protein
MSSVLGLKARPQSAKRCPEVLAEAAHDLVGEHALLALVGLLHRAHDLEVDAVLLRRAQQRRHVLGEARAAVARAGIEEVVADARIRADADAHVLDVGAERLGEERQLVHERDARGEHRVGRRTW